MFYGYPEGRRNPSFFYFYNVDTEIKAHIVIYEMAKRFTAYAPDFPTIVASGNTKREVVKKITYLLYENALQDREQYKFSLN